MNIRDSRVINGIFRVKMRVLGVKFSKRKCLLFPAKSGIFEVYMRDFRAKYWYLRVANARVSGKSVVFKENCRGGRTAHARICDRTAPARTCAKGIFGGENA